MIDKKNSIKKQKTNKLQKDNKINIIFITVTIIILILIIILSLNINKEKEDKLFTFSSSEFENITTIGLSEFQASLSFDGTSIIFFCSNEVKECYEELKELDLLAKENDLIIEYVNVLELVESEKKQLSTMNNIFKDNYYPNLLIINKGEIINTNKYLKKSEIKKLFQNNKIIE